MQTVMEQPHPTSSQTHRALVIGRGTLAHAIAEVLKNRGIDSEIRDGLSDAGDAEGFSLVFHAWFPDPKSDSEQALSDYPRHLLHHGLQCAEALTASHASPAIINFALLPAIYVGTELEDHSSSLRGGITGVTRTLARKFGKQGLRVTCVQAGLVDMPETQAWVTEFVTKAPVPAKRWANATEIAKFMVFLGVDSLYTTGQTMIIDGGLTAGITGT